MSLNPTRIRFTHPSLTNSAGDLRVFMLDAEVVVCPSCRGNGQHFRSNLDENRMVELIQEDGGEDEMEHYRRGGYDQVCSECHGRNVVNEVNWDKFARSFPKESRKINRWEDDDAEDRAYAASERRYLGQG